MGFIGYFVKLIHIPINNIVSSGSSSQLRMTWKETEGRVMLTLRPLLCPSM